MTTDNRRSEFRLPDNAIVLVEVRAASPDGSAPAEIIACDGIDLSANGLQVRLDRPLAVGSILRLGTRLAGDSAGMQVVGEVRWVRPHDGGWTVGFALFDSDGTDIVAWKQLIAARLEE